MQVGHGGMDLAVPVHQWRTGIELAMGSNMYLAPLASQCAPCNAAQCTSLPAVDGGSGGTVEFEVSEKSKVTILGLILFKLSS